jgi:hypothetical protein
VTTPRLWAAAIAAVLLVAGAIVLWWPGANGRSVTDTDTMPRAASPVPADPADDYLAFTDTLRTSPPAGTEVIVEGLRKLAAALGTVQTVEPDVPIDLRIVAEHVVLNADAVETTGVVRTSLLAVAASLERDGSGAAGLREAVDAIDPELPLTRQHDRVLDVLIRAADRIRPEKQQGGAESL